MGRKKKIQSKDMIITPTDVAQLQKEYVKEIEEDPQYSLEPDPTGELQM